MLKIAVAFASLWLPCHQQVGSPRRSLWLSSGPARFLPFAGESVGFCGRPPAAPCEPGLRAHWASVLNQPSPAVTVQECSAAVVGSMTSSWCLLTFVHRILIVYREKKVATLQIKKLLRANYSAPFQCLTFAFVNEDVE